MKTPGVPRRARLLLAVALGIVVFGAQPADALAVPSLSINDVTMNEGNGGVTNFDFTVTLSDPPAGNFTIMVNFATANGTATAGACISGGDYVSTSGQLTFNRNNLRRTITVQVCGDTVFEPNETFFVNLSNPMGGAIITKGQGIGTIVNDDARPTKTEVSCAALTVGIAATCTATVTDIGGGTPSPPSGSVSWSSSDAGGTFVPNPCVLSATAPDKSSCTVSYTPSSAGPATITATYTGDLIHSGSQGSTTVQVARRSTKTEVSCGAATVGIAASCTATVTDTAGGTPTPPTGSVNWTSSDAAGTFVPNPCVLIAIAADKSSCSVSYTPGSAGAAQITATYGGDLTHEGSVGQTTVQVAKRPTQTRVSCDDDSFEAGGSTNCTATVSDTGAGIRTTPTGIVDWTSTSTGTFFPDPCALSPTTTVGVASCTVVFSSTTAATHTITATYGGDPIHEGSEGSTTVTVTPGPPATVTLAPLFAQNQVGTQHCVTATVKDAFGNPTPGISVIFSVTGVNSTSGSRATDAQGKATFCYTGRLFGVDTIDAFADTDNDGTRDGGEPTAVPPATKAWLVPPSTPLCEVAFPTGGGRITADNGDPATFAGNAKVSSSGDPIGQEEYQDHGPAQPLNVKSIDVHAVVCTRFADGHAEATIFGHATVDGSGEYVYRIDVEDRGERGTNDTYWITLSNGYNSGRHNLDGGNVQIQ